MRFNSSTIVIELLSIESGNAWLGLGFFLNNKLMIII